LKKVISAHIDQVLQFDSENELDKFIEGLESKKQQYQVVWKNALGGGKVIMRIKKQYNNNDFVE
jgi:hypothetical protein